MDLGKLHQAARNSMEQIKINLGAGIKPIEGFINVDIEDLGKDYVKADVRKLPFDDNFADYILASEILEHIPIRDLHSTLKEWKRVLKPGGRMVIKCPDFEAMAKEWLSKSFLPQEYSEMAQGLYGKQATENEYHRSPITVPLMQYLLGSLKFKRGGIVTYSKGHKQISYPGIKANPRRVYRFGTIHCDVIK